MDNEGGRPSGSLAPSRSTVYVSNLDFGLTNNDLHNIFSPHGQIAKVTVMRDKATRRSKGVAFVLFVQREDAVRCCAALDNTVLHDRTIRCSIAKDNGRATEFIKKKTYKDKSRCFECGEDGHLSYNCPRNVYGDREPPPREKKQKKKKRKDREEGTEETEEKSGASSWYDDSDDEDNRWNRIKAARAARQGSATQKKRSIAPSSSPQSSSSTPTSASSSSQTNSTSVAGSETRASRSGGEETRKGGGGEEGDDDADYGKGGRRRRSGYFSDEDASD